MAQSKTAGTQKPGKRRSGKLAIWGFLLIFTTILLPTSMVVATALIPSFVIFMFDRSSGKALTLTVILLNLSGALPSLMTLWTTAHSIQDANDIIADPVLWFSAFGAAGIGLLIYLVMPPIMTAYYTIATESKIRLLRDRQSRLREDWGAKLAEDPNLVMLEDKSG